MSIISLIFPDTGLDQFCRTIMSSFLYLRASNIKQTNKQKQLVVMLLQVTMDISFQVYNNFSLALEIGFQMTFLSLNSTYWHSKSQPVRNFQLSSSLISSVLPSKRVVSSTTEFHDLVLVGNQVVCNSFWFSALLCFRLLASKYIRQIHL